MSTCLATKQGIISFSTKCSDSHDVTSLVWLQLLSKLHWQAWWQHCRCNCCKWKL